MSTGGVSAWGKPRGDPPPARVHAPASTVTANGPAKAKVAAKAPVNIAALAARNLGGFVPNKIFVGGVPVTCTEEQFRAYFEPYGAISKVELHALRGFGYITYVSVDAVDACLEKYEDHYFGKKWVEVKRSIPRELIDSYEREQRRLQAEQNGVSNEVSLLDRPSGPPSANAVAKGPGLPKATHAMQAEVAAPSGVPPPSRASSAAPSAAPRAAPWKSGGNREPPGTVMVSRIAQLKEMGFSEEVAKRVLAECVWDVNTAIDRLLASGTMPGENTSSPAQGPDPSSPARPSWGPADVPPSQNGVPTSPSAIRPAPAPVPATAPVVGRPWPQPTTVPEPRGCWGAGAPSLRSPSPASKTEGPSLHALEPPARGPPPPPAAVVAADAPFSAEPAKSVHGLAAGSTRGAEVPKEPTKEARQELAATEEPAPDSTGASAAEPSPPYTEVTVVPERDAMPGDVVAEGEAETRAEGVGSAADGAAEASSGIAPPRKQIQRVERDWAAEDASQMSVCEGDLVDVWVDTSTEHGWIHAEKHAGDLQVGWLPVCVLQQLPENQRWMRARQEWQAMDESQCSVEEGAAVIVWVNSRTQEGWTYVESQKEGTVRPGWLPAFCLEWSEA